MKSKIAPIQIDTRENGSVSSGCGLSGLWMEGWLARCYCDQVACRVEEPRGEGGTVRSFLKGLFFFSSPRTWAGTGYVWGCFRWKLCQVLIGFMNWGRKQSRDGRESQLDRRRERGKKKNKKKPWLAYVDPRVPQRIHM